MSEAETRESDDIGLAVKTAKAFLAKAFEGEGIENVGLEEVRPPDFGTVWHVTVGFDRRRPQRPKFADVMPNAYLQAAAEAATRPARVYKVVEVDLSGPRGVSIMNRKDD